MKKTSLNNSTSLSSSANPPSGQTKPPEKKKHKISSLCFNKCIEWKLTISYTKLKTTYSNVTKSHILFLTPSFIDIQNQKLLLSKLGDKHT